MRVHEKYIAHDPEVQERLIDVLSRVPDKVRSKVDSSMIFFDVERYIYYIEVWIATENISHLVKDIHLRGPQYHLDHIIPLSYGFTYNIPPQIIGSFFNLQVIPAKDNLSKGNDITDYAEDLLSRIDYDKTFYPKSTKIVYSTTDFYSNYKWEDRELKFERGH